MPRLKRFLPRTLFGRSLLIIVTPMVLMQVVVAYIFYERHWDTVSRHLAQGLAGDVATLVWMLDSPPGAEGQAQVLATAGEFMRLAARVEPGAILAGESLAGSGRYPYLTATLDRRLGRPFRVEDQRTPKQRVAISVQLDDGVLHITTARRRVFSSTTYIFILWMVGSSIVLLAIAIYFLRRQIRPIRRLAQAADDFGKGREVGDFKPEGATEVRQAATAFRAMRARIKRQISQRTEMLAGVSHDLRTPLTRIKLHLAMLGDGDEIASLKSDVVEMEKMIEGYLAFARGEGGEAAAPTDLGALLDEVVARGRRDGGTIELARRPEDITMAVRRDALTRCFTNLVDNAMRHGEHVVVAAERQNGSVEITIDDDGPGIPEHEREDAFRAFHRLDASRNPETGGVGLGLTIARDVVRSHGGEVVLGTSPAGGLRALVRLPL